MVSTPAAAAAAAAAVTGAAAQQPQQQQHLLRLSLHRSSSSVVHPASDGDDKPGKVSTPSSSTPPSPSGTSPGSKPHKSNDEAWEMVQSLKSQDGSLDLNQFQLLGKIGEGDIGSVFLAKLKGTSQYFAVKCMDKERLKSKNKLQRVQIEREILEMLDHPFLPTLYGSFENSEYSCLVMEFCPGGDLHKFRQRQPAKRFEEETVRFYAAEVILALEYLHMMGVVYRDLKPENVLLRGDGHIMLTDFDLSLRFDASPTMLKPQRSFRPSCIAPQQQQCQVIACSLGSPQTLLRRNGSLLGLKKQRELRRTSSSLPQINVEPVDLRSMSFVGTHEYLAPEIIAGGGHGSAVDWWTLGIFIYELLLGETPFKGSSNDATLMNAFSRPLQFPAKAEVSQAAKDLLKSLIVKDPRKRLGSARGAPDIKAHPFFEDVNWALIRCNTPPEVPKKFNLEAITAAAAAEAAAKLAEAGKFECF